MPLATSSSFVFWNADLDQVILVEVTLTPPINGSAELPATLVSELGCHVGIYFKLVGF